MRHEFNGVECDKLIGRMLWLAYQAAIPMGMGYLQARDDKSEADVIANVIDAGDYPNAMEPGVRPDQKGGSVNVSADYVFGRMMKLRFKAGDNWVELPDHEPRHDYQSWCGKYPTYAALFDAALESLNARQPARAS